MPALLRALWVCRVGSHYYKDVPPGGDGLLFQVRSEGGRVGGCTAGNRWCVALVVAATLEFAHPHPPSAPMWSRPPWWWW
jgi:hypothetical protein